MLNKKPGKSNNQFRYERKYIIPYDIQHNIYNIISSMPLRFKEIYAERKINNIYLDTSNLDSYRANLNGIGSRNKIRIRWYGDMYRRINPTLEIKVKQGNVGKKCLYPLPILNFTKTSSGVQIKNLFSDLDLPEDIEEHLKYCQPTLLNSYSRRYFLSLDQTFRCTVDFNINNLKIYNHAFEHLSFTDEIPGMIVELKYSEEHEFMARDIGNYFPFRVSRNSKYVNGLMKILN